MTDDDIREVFLANGFAIKEGQTDLKPYVYAAARALIERAAPDYIAYVQALDVALNGQALNGTGGSASRPALIDVLAQVERLVRERGQPLMNLVQPEGNIESGLRRERDSWRSEAEMLMRSLRQAHTELDLRRAHHEKDAWYWQGDGYDHLESMGNRMVVVIHAEDLRALLAYKEGGKEQADEAGEVAA
jgi:hypothetical protein